MLELAKLYLHDRGGSISEFQNNLLMGQRVGQAFHNALCELDRVRLTGTLKDVFYVHDTDAEQKIIEAIDWLLETEKE